MSIVTHESWFSRIGGAIKGMLVGGLIALVAFPLLFWNEGRAVFRARTLAEGRGAVMENVSNERVDPANEGKLVHMTGQAKSNATLQDEKFAVTADNAIKLMREVEMYQWKEKEHSESEKKLGGGRKTVTTFSYEKVWSDRQIDSSDFEPSNRDQYGTGNPAMPFETKVIEAEEVEFGAFRLSPGQIARINSFKPVKLTAAPTFAFVDGQQEGKLKVIDNQYYLGEDPASPKIGDLRVKFSEIGPREISLIAKQSNNSFQAFKTPNGSLDIFAESKQTADEMFTAEETANTTMLWILRLVGLVMMTVGISLVLRPLAVLGDVVPFVGGLVGFGVAVVAFLTAACLSLITISIAWFFYRPLFAIGLIVVAVGMLVLARMFLKKRQPDVMEVDQPVLMD